MKNKTKQKKYSRRSMQVQIKTAMMVNSNISNLILSIVVIIVCIGALHSLGSITAEVVASDIVGELENPMSMGKFNAKTIETVNQENANFKRWLNSIGNRFYFDFSSGFTMQNEADLMKLEVDELGNISKPDKTNFGQLRLVFVQIDLKGELLFTTFPEDLGVFSNDTNAIIDKYYNVLQVPYHNLYEEEIGTVSVAFNPFILIAVTTALIALFVIASILSSIISILMSKVMSGSLIKPLSELQRKMDRLAEGDVESALQSELTVKKPYMEVEKLADATNLIIENMRAYTETLEEHRIELTAQNDELADKSTNLINMNHKLEAMYAQMKDILDNVGQGFLRFESDLIIHGQYSLECKDIFNGQIAKLRLSSLIYPSDQDQASFVDELLKNILEEGQQNSHLYMPLLPDEAVINDRIINIDYKLSHNSIKKKSMIVILTDITEKRELEAQMDKEQQILKMVVKVLVNRTLFVELSESFDEFLEESKFNHWNFTSDPYENKQYVMRQLHTFKGNFSQYDVLTLTEALHDAENQMMSIDIEALNPDLGKIINSHALKHAFNHDMDIIKTYVGEDYLTKDEYFLIEKGRILEIERKMQITLSEQDCRVLLPEIRSLCYRPLKDLLKMYPEYTIKMAERLDKSIYNFNICSDDLSVDEIKFQAFTKSLVHVFRNAIDHGIESPDERAEQSKDVMGQIECKVATQGDSFEIRITDDGRGIDPEIIKSKLVDLGESVEQIKQYSVEALYLKLFEDSFSTADQTTLLSGRGVGLAVVKREVEALNGSIEVQSELGKGTQFIFRLPLRTSTDEKDIFPMTVMEALSKTCVNYLKNYVDSDTIIENVNIAKSNKIELRQLTALINLKGVINALIMLSVNRPLGRRLAEGFIVDTLEDENIDQYVEDVLAEIANTVLGNTLGLLDDSHDFLHIGVPAIISNQGAYVKYSNAEILTFTLEYENYEWSVHMILLENNGIKEEAIWQE